MSKLFSDRLLMHVDNIDHQHKALFKIVEDFNDACTNGKDKEKIAELFNILKNNTIGHFQFEEEYMLKCNYPLYNEHREKHIVFIRKISSIENKIKVGKMSSITILEINRFLTEWLIMHISKIDNQHGDYIRKNL